MQVDARQVYGDEVPLRAGSGGRLLSRLVDGREFPGCLEDFPHDVPMVFPRVVTASPTGEPLRHLPYFHLTGPAIEVRQIREKKIRRK